MIVELRGYADERWRDRSFEDYLDELSTLERMSVPREVQDVLLREGRAIVVFDGLDELFDPRVRAEAGRRIAAFAERYPDVRIVVTSRVIGYRRPVLDKAGFRHYMIQDLTMSQIEEFTERWYTVVCPGEPELAARLHQRMTDAVHVSRSVRDLAGNPLLLTILSIIGRRRQLPRKRLDVYEQAVNLLVARWDQDVKILPDPAQADMQIIDEDDRWTFLRLLARRMQEGAGGAAGNYIHGEDLEALFTAHLEQRYSRLPKERVVLAARGMIRQFRERNFILSRFGDEVYGFVHRAFLEYLAADDIARRYQRDHEWGEEELVREVFEVRARDPAWHEVLLLLVGKLGERDAGHVVDALLRLHTEDVWRGRHAMLALAVRTLAEVDRVDRLAPQSAAVVDALIDLLERKLGWTALNALENMLPALALLGPEWDGRGRYLRWFLLRGQFQARHRMASDIACALHSTPEALLLLAEHSPDSANRAEILRRTLDRWPNLPAAWDLVRGALDALDPESRRGALECLARYWGDDTGVRELLFDRAEADQAPEPRGEALESVAERWPDSEDARELVVRQAEAEPDPGLRRLALQLLSHHWADREDTWTVLSVRAVEDRDPEPRREALHAAGPSPHGRPRVTATSPGAGRGRPGPGPARGGARSPGTPLEGQRGRPGTGPPAGGRRPAARSAARCAGSTGLALEGVRRSSGPALSAGTRRPGPEAPDGGAGSPRMALEGRRGGLGPGRAPGRGRPARGCPPRGDAVPGTPLGRPYGGTGPAAAAGARRARPEAPGRGTLAAHGVLERPRERTEPAARTGRSRRAPGSAVAGHAAPGPLLART